MTDVEQRWDDVVNEEEDPRKTNFLVMVLDRSGSMNPIRDEAIGAFNDQIRQVMESTEGQNIDVLVSLVTFSGSVDEPEHWCVPLHNVSNLVQSDFVPGGMTAMYDAVGFTINKLNEHPLINDPDSSVLIVTISDGYENSSRNFTSESLATMVKEMQDSGRWTFAYEGANQDLAEVQASTGFNIGSTMSFDANVQGMAASTLTRSRASQAYYTSAIAAPAGEAFASESFYSPDGSNSLNLTEPEPTTGTIVSTSETTTDTVDNSEAE
jgi:uncharacterized protein YegL